METDEGATPRAVLLGNSYDRRCVEDESIRLHLGELVVGRVDEERLGEKCVPRVLRNDAHADSMRRIGAGKGIDDVDIAFTQPRGSFARKRSKLSSEMSALTSPTRCVTRSPVHER